MKTIETEKILNYRVANTGVASIVDSIVAWVKNSDRCRWLACINPHSYVVSLSDDALSTALNDADWLIPDGVGIVLASRFLGGRIRERVTGSDIFRCEETSR